VATDTIIMIYQYIVVKWYTGKVFRPYPYIS